MKDRYLQDVIRRGQELERLDRAARLLPEGRSAGKWMIAVALGLAGVLFPAVGAAQPFFYL